MLSLVAFGKINGFPYLLGVGPSQKSTKKLFSRRELYLFKVALLPFTKIVQFYHCERELCIAYFLPMCL